MTGPGAVPDGNPFPAEAVATFGAVLTSLDSLAYVDTARELLRRYLKTYPLEGQKSGLAVGIQGAHGSGKTHLLGRVAREVAETTTIHGRCFYAKADSFHFFEVYRQLVTSITRELLIELIQLALLRLAQSHALSAKMTESLAERLDEPGSLTQLESENNLDLDLLKRQLMSDLAERSTAPPEMARTLLDVVDPVLGLDAYRWFVAEESGGSAALGAALSLRGFGSATDVELNVAAINALELIAALFYAAGVPLVILIDQLEVLLRTPGADELNILGSHVKKFIEQLTRQDALLFIAGGPDSWSKLPHDVVDRLGTRPPLAVGGLNAEECHALLDAYLGSRGPAPPDVVANVFRLSGGSPRETLRIAHQVYARTDGRLDEADESIIIEAADKSGSISGRAMLALSIADRVLAPFGKVSQQVRAGAETIDRTLALPGGEVILGLVIAGATDAVSEVEWARRIANIGEYQRTKWPFADLLIVPVGYSTTVVTKLFGSHSHLAFDERDFESALRTRAVEANAQAARAITDRERPEVHPDARSSEMARLQARLDALEDARRQEADEVAERFARSTSDLNAASFLSRELKTRFEAQEALDLLERAITKRDSDGERAVLRSILVANEAYLRSVILDDLGNLYRDALNASRRAGGRPTRSMADDRLMIVQHMRDELRSPSRFRAYSRLGRIDRWVVGCVAATVVTGIISSLRDDGAPELFFIPIAYDFVSFLPWLSASLSVGLLYWFGIEWVLESRRRKVALKRFAEIREAIGLDRGKDSLRARYPQA